MRKEDRGGVRVITIDNPPINALSFEYCAKLLAAIEEADKDRSVLIVVFTGTNSIFSYGVDINDFETLVKTGKPLPSETTTIRDVIAAVERSNKVYIAAINGDALGGGLELSLACDYRFAASKARVGLPEIKLGLLPGAGGSQRLPRLIGAQAALEFMLKGEMHSANKAKELGILDGVFDGNIVDWLLGDDSPLGNVGPTNGAMDGGSEEAAKRERSPEGGANSVFPTDYRLPKARISSRKATIAKGIGFLALPFVVSQAHKMVPSEEKGGYAAHKLIDAVQAAVELPFPFGSAREERLFEELIRSAPSAALRHIFFAERELNKIPGLASAKPRTIEKAGVVGAGTMGTGIAITFANAGIPVTIVEPSDEQIERAKQTVLGMFAYHVQRGRLTQEEAWKRGQSIVFSSDYNDFAECDLVIEAVFENMDIKKEVFTKLDAIVKPNAIIASNTSTLDIDEMASVTKRPDKFVGLHFFAPANIMKLLEIVRGQQTSLETLATAFTLAKNLRKVAVLSANAFGFIGNRMLFDYAREAVGLAEEGVAPYRIDAALKNFGFAMGPFAMFDLSGIDVMWHIEQARPDMGAGRTNIMDRLYKEKRLGQKTAKGFYIYDKAVGKGREPIRDEHIERILAEEAKAAGIAQHPSVSDAEIVGRLTRALYERGKHLLADGVALRSGDIDIAYVYGYGFPPYHGGPMWYYECEVNAQKEPVHA